MGKSYCLRCFSKSLNPNLNHMVYLCLSTILVAEFYKQFCSVLCVSDKGGKISMFTEILEQVYYLYKEKRQPLLLAIDEAQYLSTGILNDIKTLMDYGYDSINCFTLILCGESHWYHISLPRNKPDCMTHRTRMLYLCNYVRDLCNTQRFLFVPQWLFSFCFCHIDFPFRTVALKFSIGIIL